MNEETDYESKLVRDLIQIVEDQLDIRRWGFHLSHTKLEKPASTAFKIRLIYDSEWCRIQFSYDVVPGIPYASELHTSYGRLHAPSDGYYMGWNSENCRSWHSVGGFTHLYFLDGYSPSETWINSRLPRVVEEFRESDLGKQLRNERGPRSEIAEENAIWNHYGVRLFELFDLRRPDLWEQYIHYLRDQEEFINETFRLKGKKPITFDPPRWKIC